MNELKTMNGVVALMSKSSTQDEWNDNCDKVKAANNGYPDFWFEEIILSGIEDEVSNKYC